MKALTLILLLALSQMVYSQNDDDPLLIQNFYMVCKSKNYSAFSAINTGIQLFDTKQYSRSLNNFEKALEKDPTCCDAWYLIGYCYQKKQDYARAIEACDKSLSMNQNNPSALIIKANTKILMKDTLNTIELFRKAIQYLPDKIDGYYGLALMLHMSGKDNEAKVVLSNMDQHGAKTPKIRDNKKISTLRESLK